MSTSRALTLAAAATSALFVLACGAGVANGERASLKGECPEGEVCSESTPAGLMFIGAPMYDSDGEPRLGPVLVGGEFNLDFFSAGGPIPGEVALRIDSPVMTGELTDQDSAVLTGVAEGEAMVRVVDASTGELHDRLSVQSVLLRDVELRNATDQERPALYAGCTEMVGIDLIAISADGVLDLRAVDQGIEVHALQGPEVEADRWIWDCFRYDVPEGVTEATFEISVAGQVHVATLDVIERGDQDCPVLSD